MVYQMSCNEKTKIFLKKRTTDDERKIIFEELFDPDCLFRIVKKFGLSCNVYRLGDILFKVDKLNQFEKHKFFKKYLFFKKFNFKEEDFILMRHIITNIKYVHIYRKIIYNLILFYSSFTEEMILFFILNRKTNDVIRLLEEVKNDSPVVNLINNSFKIKEALTQLFQQEKSSFNINNDLFSIFPILLGCLTNKQKVKIIL